MSSKLALANAVDTSTNVLDELSNDKDVNVRYCVVKNPNTSTNSLIRLSEDESISIKRAAEHRLCGWRKPKKNLIFFDQIDQSKCIIIKREKKVT